MAKRTPLDKVLLSLHEFLDSKSTNIFSVAPAIAAMPNDQQAEFFKVCVHYIDIVSQRGLDNAYINHPVMEYNSITARRMMGDTFD